MLQLAKILSIVFLTLPTVSWAEQSPGTVSGTIGDRAFSVEIWAEQSDFYGDGNAGGVSIMTRPVARDEGLGWISIGFEGSDFLGGDISNFEVDIRDSKAANMSYYYANSRQDLRFAITRAEKNDDILSISGTVQGTLIWHQLMPISDRRVDPSRQLSVNLTFDAVIKDE